MHLPVVITEDPTDADVVLTLKNYYRRKPQPLRDAEANGTPIYVLRGNSGGQIEEGLGGSCRWTGSTTSAATSALQETEDAISQRPGAVPADRAVAAEPPTSGGSSISLPSATTSGSRSLGREPYRRVQIFPREA